MSNWISTKDSLPEPGKYVLAKHSRGTWNDSDDKENVNAVVVKLVMGLTMEERQSPLNGRSDRLSEWSYDYQRKKVYKSEDENGNNLVGYNWQQFGPDSFFGQDISHWMSIPSMTGQQKITI